MNWTDYHNIALSKSETGTEAKQMAVIRLGFVYSLINDIIEDYKKKYIQQQKEINQLKSQLTQIKRIINDNK